FVVGSDSGFNRFIGGAGHDVILGSTADDVIGIYGRFGPEDSVEVIDGNGGDDVIRGRDSRDILDFSHTTLIGIAEIQGGGGSDFITGSDGDDTIVGGGGVDVMDGGAGDDTFLVEGDDGFDRFIGGAGFD